MFETNVHGLMRMTRLCLPHIRDGGHIVNIGSIAGRQAYENGASYIASKFAVRGFTYALREDLLGRPIRITTVDAGVVETEFSIVRFKGDVEQAKAVYEGIEPLTPTTSPTASCSRSPARRTSTSTRSWSRRATSVGRTVLREPYRRSLTALTILEGSTFCICDDRGDLRERTAGCSRSTRAFSRGSLLTINGERAAAALVRQGRVLLGGVLPAQPAPAGLPPDSRARSSASASSATGCRIRSIVTNETWSRSRSSSRSSSAPTSRTSSR